MESTNAVVSKVEQQRVVMNEEEKSKATSTYASDARAMSLLSKKSTEPQEEQQPYGDSSWF